MAHRGVVLLLLLALLGPARAQDRRPVVFVVNDALVKDHPLAGVQVTLERTPGAKDGPTGTTDAAGRLVLAVAPGAWRVSYELPGYVPLRDTPLEVGAAGQEVTTSLLPALEGEAGEGGAPARRRIALVLNWGADESRHVRDVDSHLAVETTHVYFSRKVGSFGDASLELDVDDTSWGGPETITVLDPAPGRYVYWVHDWSEGPGRLGSSELVVRLLVGDTVAGEWRAPPSATGRVWRPFEALSVAADGAVVAEPFAPEALAAGADRAVPAAVQQAVDWSSPGQADAGACCVIGSGLLASVVFAAVLLRLALKTPGR